MCNDWEKHSENVARFSFLIGINFNLSIIDLKNLYISAKYHDIGKCMIDSSILDKSSKLDLNEMNIIKKHPYYGYKILKEKNFNKNILEGVLYHHERWDGLGYTKGLIKDNIPLISRIIAVADTYDAITSRRSYKSKMSSEFALNEIIINAGTQFDPKVVDIFKNLWACRK
ncbi:MAG: HD domain-containing protein [Bacilli bacterium]